MSQEERSEALIEVLEDLQGSDIDFVLVGGYAVSQFETRFSTDLDLVIAPDDYDEVVAFLEEHEFERQDELEVPPEETIYNREIELFERTEGLVHPVGVDVLVNGLGCRQTKAEWSFEYLREHSTEQTIPGGSRSTTARTADGEILVAAKLHSGRPTDLADCWLLCRRSTSRRWRSICTAATRRPFAPSSVKPGSSSKMRDWITGSRASSDDQRRLRTTSRHC